MESKSFLLNFSNLSSGSEDLIKSALTAIKETLLQSSGQVETMLGTITPDLKYTIDRLLKGLMGGKLAKTGFSLALLMLIKEFSFNTDKLFESFESFDQSGISQTSLFSATILISLSLSRSKKLSSKENISKIIEIYKKKSAFQESAALALLSLPNIKSFMKKIETGNDINGLLINYSIQSPETTINQSMRHKDVIIKGSFRSFPRLHSI